MPQLNKALLILLLLVCASSPGYGQIPATTAKALDGTPVIFPKPGSKKPLLIVIGFSNHSSVDFQKWDQQYKSKYPVDSRVDYYELAELQGVPSFVRPLILHGMRNSMPKAKQACFAPIYKNEDDWKRLARIDNPDVAYLMLADSSGHVVWQTHGPATSEKSAELEAAVVKLSGSSSGH